MCNWNQNIETGSSLSEAARPARTHKQSVFSDCVTKEGLPVLRNDFIPVFGASKQQWKHPETVASSIKEARERWRGQREGSAEFSRVQESSGFRVWPSPTQLGSVLNLSESPRENGAAGQLLDDWRYFAEAASRAPGDAVFTRAAVTGTTRSTSRSGQQQK